MARRLVKWGAWNLEVPGEHASTACRSDHSRVGKVTTELHECGLGGKSGAHPVLP
jgi:hypothetical protein